MASIGNNIQFNRRLEMGYFSFLFALLSVIIMPIHVKYLSPLMVLWAISWILENYSRIKNMFYIRKEYLLLFLFFVLYYLWQAVSVLYSENLKMGFLNLFSRISLLIFPSVLIFPGKTLKARAGLLARIFALCSFLYLVYCFGFALFRSVTLSDGSLIFNPHPADFWLNYFYSAELTINKHPSYVAMYALLSCFICFETWFNFSFRFRIRIFWLAIGILLLISQYFLSSRAGIVISLILIPFYYIVKLRKLGKIKFYWILIVVVIITLIPVILKNPRMDYSFGRILNTQVNYERKEDPRFKIWAASFNVVKNNILLGVGIGDVRTELATEYARIGEENMAKERFNAHNQFLEVLIETGIIGFLLFMSIFACMIYIALIEKNIIYGLFILMIIMFFMFETVLYRIAGVTFFSIFSFLLLYVNNLMPEKDALNDGNT